MRPRLRTVVVAAMALAAAAAIGVVIGQRRRKTAQRGAAARPETPHGHRRAGPSLASHPAPAPAPSQHRAEPPAPPRPLVYPAVVAPERLVGGEEADIIVGLSRSPVPGVAGGPLDVEGEPDVSLTVEFDVELDGFKLAAGSPAGSITLSPGAERVGRAVRVMAGRFVQNVRAARVHVSFARSGRRVGEADALTIVERR